MESQLTIIEQVVSVQILEPDKIQVDIVEEPVSVEIGEVHNVYYNDENNNAPDFLLMYQISKL